MDVRRRDLISGLMACAGGFARPALGAPHTRPLTLRQLVDASELVVDVVLELRESVWVEVFGARRIVTFWRLEVGKSIVGRAAGNREVVTLGGVVDGVQQWVPHEAALSSGQRQLVFLRKGPFEQLWVTGMLQGAFELTLQGSEVTVGIAPTQRELVEVQGSAVSQLAGIRLHVAERAIEAEWNS